MFSTQISDNEQKLRTTSEKIESVISTNTELGTTIESIPCWLMCLKSELHLLHIILDMFGKEIKVFVFNLSPPSNRSTDSFTESWHWVHGRKVD